MYYDIVFVFYEKLTQESIHVENKTLWLYDRINRFAIFCMQLALYIDFHTDKGHVYYLC